MTTITNKQGTEIQWPLLQMLMNSNLLQAINELIAPWNVGPTPQEQYNIYCQVYEDITGQQFFAEDLIDIG